MFRYKELFRYSERKEEEGRTEFQYAGNHKKVKLSGTKWDLKVKNENGTV